MKLTSLLLGLCIGSVGTAGFYAYSFDKSEYDWIAPQSVRAVLSESTAILGNKTDGLLKNIETWTGIELEPIKGSLIQLAGSVKAEDGHNHAGHGDEKDHGHSEDGHKDDDHGDEKDHGHSEEGHNHADHGDEKDHGHSEDGHKDDDHGDEKEHGHSEDGHKDDDHGNEKEHAHGNDDDGHGHEEEDVIRLTASQQQEFGICLLYTSPSPRDQRGSRMPSSA